MTTEAERLGAEKYVLLTTYRKDGTAVPTPVWAATDDGELVIFSERKAGKVKRIRNDGKVLVQACDLRGSKTHGPAVPGRARLLDAERTAHALDVIARDYGVFGRVTMFFSRLRGPKDRTVGIAVKLDA
ncbi:PPOX class F420-dependent oxidoreductase [Amycolatopsis sp. K13G38]|uniref:PPOX class F420-dependent oxidoreductase n=1 Tax=Amycolatopsis acididurans TaxID=2724524 RepID=A0ABX1JD55_9PSEU|nr:PPOX class F420-dependent oxidoreductase [Amycolatopsis acididurans]NKQ56570.1 PPOX class F420-dependent oxidoreductase [Amycolatopsis acididurans]